MALRPEHNKWIARVFVGREGPAPCGIGNVAMEVQVSKNGVVCEAALDALGDRVEHRLFRLEVVRGCHPARV